MFIGKIILSAVFLLMLASCVSEQRMTTTDDALLAILPARFRNTGIDVPAKAADAPPVERVISALKVIDARPLKIDSVKASMEVTVTTAESCRTLNGQFTADRSGNARLRLTAIIGIVAVDLCIKDGEMVCVMPAKKIAFKDSCSELKSGGPDLLALLVSVVNVSDMISPRAWEKDASGRRLCLTGGQAQIDVHSAAAGAPRLRQAALNIDDRVLRSQRIYSPKGALLGEIEYSGYATKRCAGWEDPLPRRVAISTPEGRVRVEMILKKVEINCELSESSFTLVTRDPLQPAESLVEALSGK